MATGAARDDPLYRAHRRTPHTVSDLLTDRQQQPLTALFDAEKYAQVKATWGIYQRMVRAYREPDRAKEQQLMTRLIKSLSHVVPAALTELITLGRTLKIASRGQDVLA